MKTDDLEIIEIDYDQYIDRRERIETAAKYIEDVDREKMDIDEVVRLAAHKIRETGYHLDKLVGLNDD